MRSMTVSEFETQVRKTQTETAVTPKPTDVKKQDDQVWWESYRSGSFC
jgi:hypothetical protein